LVGWATIFLQYTPTEQGSCVIPGAFGEGQESMCGLGPRPRGVGVGSWWAREVQTQESPSFLGRGFLNV
jgi:hypothetical protein